MQRPLAARHSLYDVGVDKLFRSHPTSAAYQLPASLLVWHVTVSWLNVDSDAALIPEFPLQPISYCGTQVVHLLSIVAYYLTYGFTPLQTWTLMRIVILPLCSN